MADLVRKPDKGIRLNYKPSDEEKNDIRFVYDRLQSMRDSSDRQEAERNWDKWEKQWEGFRPQKGREDWQSNHVVPLTMSIVETALSEIIKQNLRPFFLPRGKEDKAKTTIFQHAWDYAAEISDDDILMYDATHEFLIYGTVIAQEMYRVDKRKIGTITMGKDGKEVLTEEEVADYNDVDAEIVKLQDFYVDEFARSFTGSYAARDCIRRYLMDIDEFHRIYDDSVWDQYKNAKYVKAGGDITYYEYFQPPQGMDTSKQVEVLHYWNKPLDKFMIVANDVLIRNNPNPYKHKQLPFARGVDIKRTHKFYAKGEPELLESIQDEINTIRRMTIDRAHLDIDKMFIGSNRLQLADEDLIARPHGFIPSDDPNGMKAVEYGDTPRSVEITLKHLEDDSTISTGINPRSQALPQAGTATEAAILKESTLRRIETKIFLLKREFLTRRARLRASNMLQFYSQPKLEKILGETDSARYQLEVQNAQSAGQLEMVEGQAYKNGFKEIRVTGKEITFDEKGNPVEKDIQGYSFLELKPNYYMPVAGSFDVRYNVGVNVEISRELMRTKNMELYDRIMRVAMQMPGSYDPIKISDMLIEDANKNPDDFKMENLVAQNQEAQRLRAQIQLASFENQMMIKGQEVPATKYASPAHTQIHTEFMLSPAFQQTEDMDHKISTIFTRHVIGEMMAQEARGIQGIGAPMNEEMPQMQPQLPGQQGQATSINQGKENKSGGMKKPANKIGDVMPGLNSGGSSHLP